MLFSEKRLSFLLFILIYTATHPRITARNKPFCKSVKPSVATTSETGSTTGGTVVDDAGFVGIAMGTSAGSSMPGWNAAPPYTSVCEADDQQSTTAKGAFARDCAGSIAPRGYLLLVLAARRSL